MTTHDEQYTQDVDELAADLVGLVRRVGAIGNAAVQELARWSCHTYAGWDTSDERGGDVIEDAIDEAIERLGLDPMAVHRLIGIEVIQ